jgi:hypothetical protein
MRARPPGAGWGSWTGWISRLVEIEIDSPLRPTVVGWFARVTYGLLHMDAVVKDCVPPRQVGVGPL